MSLRLQCVNIFNVDFVRGVAVGTELQLFHFQRPFRLIPVNYSPSSLIKSVILHFLRIISVMTRAMVLWSNFKWKAVLKVCAAGCLSNPKFFFLLCMPRCSINSILFYSPQLLQYKLYGRHFRIHKGIHAVTNIYEGFQKGGFTDGKPPCNSLN
jgi:hypothetical protein